MMREFAHLVYNEFEKIYRKKRFAVVTLIVLVLIPIFIYAQHQQVRQAEERLGTSDWRVQLQQTISNEQNRLSSSGGMPSEWQKFRQLQMQQFQYYLENDINPNEPGAPTFTRGVISQGVTLFIPLLVMIIAIDIVSGERADGTIKMLLTRPIRRWKILLSKYTALLFGASIVVFMYATLSFLLSGIFFGFKGLDQPIITGFTIAGDQLVTTNVHTIPQWQFLLMLIGLAWFVTVVIATISFMVSVLVRNTPAGMGAMFASLIAGLLLQQLAGDWEGVKYIYSVNLELTSYLSGAVPMLQGLSLGFSTLILSIWSIVTLIIAFAVFTREDMLA